MAPAVAYYRSPRVAGPGRPLIGYLQDGSRFGPQAEWARVDAGEREAPGTADQVATQADDGLSGALIGAAVASGVADASSSLAGGAAGPGVVDIAAAGMAQGAGDGLDGEADPEVLDLGAAEDDEELLFTSDSD